MHQEEKVGALSAIADGETGSRGCESRTRDRLLPSAHERSKWAEERVNCFTRAREENAGAIFRQKTKSRGAAQANFCVDKSLVEGDSCRAHKFYKERSGAKEETQVPCLPAGRDSCSPRFESKRSERANRKTVSRLFLFAKIRFSATLWTQDSRTQAGVSTRQRGDGLPAGRLRSCHRRKR